MSAMNTKGQNVSKRQKTPLRKCTGCGEMKPKKDMLRVIKTDTDEIFIDMTGKKNGRGAYICHSTVCFDKARRTKGIERSLKTVISDDIYDSLKKELEDNG